MDDLTPGTEVPLDEIISDPSIRSTTPEEIRATDPFAGTSKRFETDREINLAQLQFEIEEATGFTVQIQMHPPLAEENAIIWVSPGKDIDGRKVVGKIKSHVPDPLFGLSDEQKVRVKIGDKLRAGKVLTNEEISLMLASMIDRR